MPLKIAGVIAEYNPFHNGHRHHIEQTRERTDCDFVVCAMAGHFTQRGEPAALSKWARARMALLSGVDAVFELPALFAVRTADWFALGGTSVLGGLGCDFLSFGSEVDDPALLNRLSDLRLREPGDVSEGVRRRLDLGMSHARARGEAVAEHLNLQPGALNLPNATLAVEYLSAMKRLDCPMEPVIIARRNDYHGTGLSKICSATAIRRALARGEDASFAVPEACRELLPTAPRLPLDMLALHRLRQGNLSLPDAGEGLDQLLTRAARESGTVDEMIDRVKSRRYTRARITRAVAHAMCGLTAELAEALDRPPYARLLGMREGARPLIKELSRRAMGIALASDPAELCGDECFRLECRFTDIWALGEPDPSRRRAGREFTERFVLV
ncbi:MAG: nucleotidyltransferase family protein [Clostridiales bacterium]|nr:nucleotidyltransferase family protein [Clostridiales bacterium]